MQDDFRKTELVSAEIAATDTHEEVMLDCEEMEESKNAEQCQAGVCHVVWKPIRKIAAA